MSKSPRVKNTTATYDRIDGDIYSGQNQVRDFSVDGVHRGKEQNLSRNHIDNLVAVLKDGHSLDRVDVYPNPEGGADFILIDGHHRLQAYREAHELGYRNSKSLPVKVHLDVTPKEARLMAFNANKKDKLSMSKEQKPQEAWLTLWRHWDDLKDLGGERISSWMGGVIRKSLAADMKKVIKRMIAEDTIYSKQLNSDNPVVEPWKVVRKKYDRGGQVGDLEERRLKAYVDLQSKVYRLQDSPEWQILEEGQRLQLASLLVGESLITKQEEQLSNKVPW
ncbi:ParB N-terminal domain-containing protein [Thiomicrorhabdus sediminis]|uniref:ParB-like nuclease domain-containing protein n=1 Tax=Thiomicrorhabdus sediminis TaxID=2580412 RepID=A0A4P9K6C2_9GAMM|nr:ParB N-terminal domain-containing protein [Thiomicrorhabdus sediminis]QCU90549.1 hypothetical protein FE785_07835 [Thiomicrorhabdus sediminis]